MIAPGARLSHFEIMEKLGEGGMGAVYKARDLNLDRLVAIKLLSAGAVANPERQARFVQEAKAASSLNHPNIITVYEIDTAGDTPFIAMEYIDGKTVDRLIPARGMPLDEALQYAIQIASALSDAHTAGITHRDLKPANVMVSEKGLVKVLDFGLAKLSEQASESSGTPGGTAVATASIQQLHTEEGTILGTFAYMSPEQAQGKKVDGRSDIFSFGVMLYQMLTGVRPFRGDTKLSTLAAILEKEPEPAGQRAAGLPGEMDRILSRCLRKDPARRFQTMADLKVALEEMREESGSGRLSVPAVAPGRKQRWPAIAGIAVAVLVLAAVLWLLKKPGKPAPPQTVVPLTTYAGSELYPSFSPDGNQVAFSWDGDKEDNYDIYIKQVDGGTPVRLTTDPASDGSPAWSPDGRSIAFVRSPGGDKHLVMLIPSIGGPERKLFEITGARVAWTPDAKWLAFADGQPSTLYLFSLATGERRRLTTSAAGSSGDDSPAFSPDGRRLAFNRHSTVGFGDIYVLSLTADFQPAGAPVQLTKTGDCHSPFWTADGELVYCTLASPVRLLRMRATPGATPTPVVSEGGSYPAISRQGNRLAYSRAVTDYNIWRAAAQGAKEAPPPVPLIVSTRDDRAGRYSPDEKHIAFESERSGRSEIWIANADGTNPIQVTSLDGQLCGSPYWSPDGQHIAFDWLGSGNWDVYVIPVSGGKPMPLTNAPSADACPTYSRNGKWIYFASDRSGRSEIWKAPAQGGAAVQVTRNGGHVGIESPDGAWLYFTRSTSRTTPLMRMPAAGGQEIQVLPAVYNRAFAPASNGVYFTQRDGRREYSIRFLDSATGNVRTLQKLTRTPFLYLDLSPAEQYVLWSQADQYGSDLMLIDNFR